MFRKRSVERPSTPGTTPESMADYKHPIFESKERDETIARLLGDDDLAVENESERGYDPNDSAIRRLRY